MAQLIYTTPAGYVFVIEFDATVSEQHTQTAQVTEHPVETGVNIADHVRPQLGKIQLEGFVTNTPINSAAFDNTLLYTDKVPVGLIAGAPTPFVLEAPAFARSSSGQQSALTRQRIVAYAQVTGGTPGVFSSLAGAAGLPSRLNGTPRPFVPATATPGRRVEESIAVGGTAWQATARIDRVRIIYETLRALCREGRQVQLLTKIYEYPEVVLTSVSTPVTKDEGIQFSLEFSEVRKVDTKTVEITKRKPKPKQKRAEPKVDEGPKATYKRKPTPRLQSNAHALLNGTAPENANLVNE